VGDEHWTWEHGDGPGGLLDLGQTDHTITDAPYSKRVDDNNAAERLRDPGKFVFEPMSHELLERAAQSIAATTRRWALVSTDYEEGSYLWRCALERYGMKFWQTGHWRRIGGKPQITGRGPAAASECIVICHGAQVDQRWNGGGKFAEWSAPIVRGDEKTSHPTQKPTLLLKMLIEDFTDPGDLVADIFGGVASTGVAAIGSGRRFWGREKEESFYLQGLDRLRMPLFDKMPLQSSLYDNLPAKGHVQRARMELDREVLRIVESTNGDGANLSLVAEAFPTANAKELQRALQRLVTRRSLRREGKTASTRYYPAKPHRRNDETRGDNP
jgi:hypothetical protein